MQAFFVVWALLSVLYFTVPMIQMPTMARVAGPGAGLFLGLAAVVAVAQFRRKAVREQSRDRG